MKRVVFALCALSVMLCGCAESELESQLKGVLEGATVRYVELAEKVERGSEEYPYAYVGDKMEYAMDDSAWARGYFPGSLWLLAEWQEDESLAETARVLTHRLNDKLSVDNAFDLAMIVNVAHYNVYKDKVTPGLSEALGFVASTISKGYTIGYRVAKNLDTDPVWCRRVAVWSLPAMEFLFDIGWSGNAVGHAKHIRNNQVREDGAVYEGQIYNGQTLEVGEHFSLHGKDATSAWSRGQAWALYGFTMLYRKSGEKLFLEQAERTAQYIMAQLAEDGIPNWDFDSAEELKDSSAAAIMASAFVDLYNQTNNKEYLAVAERQLSILCSAEYLATAEECGGMLLRHGVGNRMTGEAVDASLIYGDYYLIEAITRYLDL